MAEMQQTLVVIKPDGVQRGLIGPILTRFEQRGFRILALKLITVGQPMAETHYAVHQGKFFYADLVGYISSGPVLAMVLEGIDAIKAVRLMVGSTRPYEAAPGTISQLRGCASALISHAKGSGSTLVLVGHGLTDASEHCCPPRTSDEPRDGDDVVNPLTRPLRGGDRRGSWANYESPLALRPRLATGLPLS